MKKLKLIMAVITAFVCLNLAFAVKPKNESPENIAISMVSKLDKDVALTDSQKVIILSKAKLFVVSIRNSNVKSNIEEKIEMKSALCSDYELGLDSLLTTSQKEQLQLKRDERRQTSINKNTKNK